MKANLFKNLFYLPNYLSLPAAGIEICNNSIKYIEFNNKKGEYSVKNYGEVFLAPNIVKEGQLQDKVALVKALIEVKGKIKSDFVKVAIPEEKTFIFDVQLPIEAKSNIRQAIEFKIEENVPLKLEDSYFEFEIVEENIKSKEMTVNVSVMHNKVISTYTEVIEQAGLYPLSFEIESKMIASSVVAKGDKGNYIIVNIKDDSTVFVAVINGFVRDTSTVSVGESAINTNLQKTALFSDELIVGSYFENDFPFETKYTKESYASLVNVFSILKDEIEKFNEYVVNKFSNPQESSPINIHKIILCGKSSTLPGLAKHINQNIHTEVVLANVWSNVFDIRDFDYSIKFQDSLKMVTPIGLVISSYKKINA
jgi:type IV pilus assembly protein PilM